MKIKCIGILAFLAVAMSVAAKTDEISVFELKTCLSRTRKEIETNQESFCFVKEKNHLIQLLGNTASVHVYFESNEPKIYMMTFLDKDVKLKKKSEATIFYQKFHELEERLESLMKAKSVPSPEKLSRDFLPENCVLSDTRKLKASVWSYGGVKFNLFMACITEDFVKKENGFLTLQLRIEKP